MLKDKNKVDNFKKIFYNELVFKNIQNTKAKIMHISNYSDIKMIKKYSFIVKNQWFKLKINKKIIYYFKFNHKNK